MKWNNKYLKSAAWVSMIIWNAWIGYKIVKVESETDEANLSHYVMTPQDSLKNVIAHLTPEKLTELRELYSRTYWKEIQQERQQKDSLGANEAEENVFLFTQSETSDKLKTLQQVKDFYASDSVVVHHDTIQIPENKKIRGGERGFAMTAIPQVSISFFNYNGENQELTELATDLNKERFLTLLHEVHHIKYHKLIYQVPLEQRKRGIWALNEFLAHVAKNLGEYATVNKGVKSWDDAYETTIYTGDIEYNIPGDVQAITDRAINDALNKVSKIETYRKDFIESEERYMLSREDGKDNPNKTGTYAEALSQMRSAFKINGKKVDIFSLASEKVRKRAEDFINDRDDDMRLVMFAHDNKIKL